MALTITCKTCDECYVFFGTGGKNPVEGECRLNPPIPVSAYSAAYPVVRAKNPGCACGSKMRKPPAKKKPATKKVKNES